MPKEQWHNWGRYIFLAMVIIFGSGGWVMKVRSNSNDIDTLEKEVKVVQKDVHNLELSDKDIANLAQKSVDYMTRINKSLDNIQRTQVKQADILSEQKTIQAVNSQKLQTLTKD